MPDAPIVCPACSSGRYAQPSTGKVEAAACLDCGLLFVPETRLEPEAQLCNDCAFRPGSPERSDPYKWAELIQTTIVDAVHPFYCHKGMKCELQGTTLKYVLPTEGTEAMTECAGWRSRKLAFAQGTPARKL